MLSSITLSAHMFVLKLLMLQMAYCSTHMQSLLETSENEKVDFMRQWTDVAQQKQKADKHVSKLQVLQFVCMCASMPVHVLAYMN